MMKTGAGPARNAGGGGIGLEPRGAAGSDGERGAIAGGGGGVAGEGDAEREALGAEGGKSTSDRCKVS